MPVNYKSGFDGEGWEVKCCKCGKMTRSPYSFLHHDLNFQCCEECYERADQYLSNELYEDENKEIHIDFCAMTAVDKMVYDVQGKDKFLEHLKTQFAFEFAKKLMENDQFNVIKKLDVEYKDLEFMRVHHPRKYKFYEDAVELHKNTLADIYYVDFDATIKQFKDRAPRFEDIVAEVFKKGYE